MAALTVEVTVSIMPGTAPLRALLTLSSIARWIARAWAARVAAVGVVVTGGVLASVPGSVTGGVVVEVDVDVSMARDIEN